MTYQFLQCEQEENVATVTLNRPEKRNALSIALRHEIVHCLDELEKQEAIKVVILTGTGPAFCAGFDLSELAGGKMQEIFAQAVAYHRKVYTFPKPLIAAVNGPALAGGMDLAVMCDVRIAAETATFGQPQVRLGIAAAYDLIRTALPEAIARELCLSGRQMDAQEALRVGLVNRVVPGEKLLEETHKLAREIAASQASQAMKQHFLTAQLSLFPEGS